MSYSKEDVILSGFKKSTGNLSATALLSKVYEQDYLYEIMGLKKKIKRSELNGLAEKGDVVALACLGAILLENGDEYRAAEYFKAAVNSENNRLRGVLEHAIGTWTKDPYEKAKYFRLAIGKRHDQSKNSLIKCFPAKIKIHISGSRSHDSYPIGDFHVFLLEGNKFMLTHFIQQHPDKIRELFIQYPIEVIQRVSSTADTYFKQYQNELVDQILTDLLKQDKAINPENIEEVQRKYEKRYDISYFDNMPKLIAARCLEIENRGAPDAVLGLESLINIKIRDLLYKLKAVEPSKSESDLTPEEQEWLAEYLDSAEKRKTPENMELSDKSIDEKQRLLELAAAAMVYDVLHPIHQPSALSPYKEETKNPDNPPVEFLNTEKYIRALSAMKRASEALSQVKTRASKNAELSWGEFIAVCATMLVPIIGIPLVIGMIYFRYQYGTYSLLREEAQMAGKTKLATEKASGFFQETTKDAQTRVKDLPTVKHGKLPKSN